MNDIAVDVIQKGIKYEVLALIIGQAAVDVVLCTRRVTWLKGNLYLDRVKLVLGGDFKLALCDRAADLEVTPYTWTVEYHIKLGHSSLIDSYLKRQALRSFGSFKRLEQVLFPCN